MMTHKDYILASGVIFAFVAGAHVLRLIYGWHVTVNGFAVPMWASWIALILAGYLAFQGISSGKRN